MGASGADASDEGAWGVGAADVSASDVSASGVGASDVGAFYNGDCVSEGTFAIIWCGRNHGDAFYLLCLLEVP